MEKQLVKLIVLFIKLKAGVIQKRAKVRLGGKGPQKNGRWKNVVLEVGGCGERVALEVHRNRIKKKNLREN